MPNETVILRESEIVATLLRESESSDVVRVVEDVTSIVREAVQGPPGPSSSGTLSIANFAWGDATPALLVTITGGKRVYRVRLFIETVFNGANASLAVGTAGNPEELMGTNGNSPYAVSGYENYPDKRYLTTTQLLLTIVSGAGASAGAGQVHIEIEP